MPAIDKNKSEEQRLAEIHAQNNRTAAYRLRDLASSFKHLSPAAQKQLGQLVCGKHWKTDTEEVLRDTAERIEACSKK